MSCYTADFPMYNPHRPCPKCGHYLVSTRHVKFPAAAPLGDALERKCQRCDYTWRERSNDDRAVPC